MVSCVAHGFILGLSVNDAVWRLTTFRFGSDWPAGHPCLGSGMKRDAGRGYKSEKYKEITAELARCERKGARVPVSVPQLGLCVGLEQKRRAGGSVGVRFAYPTFFGVVRFSAHADDLVLNHLRASK